MGSGSPRVWSAFGWAVAVAATVLSARAAAAAAEQPSASPPDGGTVDGGAAAATETRATVEPPPTSSQALEAEDPRERRPHERERSDWSLAYLRRPPTLPKGAILFRASGFAFGPRSVNLIDPRVGLPVAFHSYATLGADASFGASDRLELSAAWPKMLCYDAVQPSGCSPYARWAGSGVSAALRLTRTEAHGSALGARISLASSEPRVFRWTAYALVKSLITETFGATSTLTLFRNINPPPTAISNPLIARASVLADIQLTEEWLIFGGVVPWTSVADIADGIALEVIGGLLVAFPPGVQISFDAGRTNVLDEPRWNGYVPGTFATLAVAVWYL